MSPRGVSLVAAALLCWLSLPVWCRSSVLFSVNLLLQRDNHHCDTKAAHEMHLPSSVYLLIWYHKVATILVPRRRCMTELCPLYKARRPSRCKTNPRGRRRQTMLNVERWSFIQTNVRSHAATLCSNWLPLHSRRTLYALHKQITLRSSASHSSVCV